MNEFKKHIEDKKKRDIKSGQCRNSLFFFAFSTGQHILNMIWDHAKQTTNMTISKPKNPTNYSHCACVSRQKKNEQQSTLHLCNRTCKKLWYSMIP